MLALQRLVVDRLKADADLVAMATILNRWIAESGQGATPEAFALAGGRVRLKRTVAVLSGTEPALPNSEAQRGRFRVLNVHSFFEATQGGKDAFDLIDGRVRSLLDGWQAVLPGGAPAAVSEEEATEPIALDGFDGYLTCRRRFVGEFVRR